LFAAVRCTPYRTEALKGQKQHDFSLETYNKLDVLFSYIRKK